MRRYEEPSEFRIEDHSLYFYCVDVEDRSKMCVSQLESTCCDTDFVELAYLPTDEVKLVSTGERYKLKSKVYVPKLLQKFGRNRVYFEVTGMSNRLAAPLLKWALKLGMEVHVVYAEPSIYDPDVFKQHGLFENNPKQYDGIKPLPGLASIIDEDDAFLFVALLGFEGGRFAYILDKLEPMEDMVMPVIGVPGYRIEYPFVTYVGNQSAIIRSKAKDNIRYAAANSIVDAYLLLTHIFQDYNNRKIIIAPIGTKPHCIAAILFALKHDKKVEVVYDMITPYIPYN